MVGRNEGTVKHMPTNAYINIACYISSLFVRIPLAPIQRNEPQNSTLWRSYDALAYTGEKRVLIQTPHFHACM